MLEMFLLLNEKQRNKCEYIRVSFIFLGLSTCSMGISLVQREVVFESFSHSHITLYSEAEFVGVRGFGRRIFSQQKGGERESLE